MKKQNLSEDDLDNLLNSLSESAATPQGKYSAKESYNILEKRLPITKSRQLPLLKYAAVASILLVIGLSVYLYRNISRPQIITITTAAHTQETILPDGTLVTLSHYSSLEYPARFDGNTREVSLSGEGFFEVAKDKKHPFIVQAQDVRVKVLGTHFNIQSYTNDPYIKTTLLEGSVAVSNTKNDNEMILKPNESAIFFKESGELIQETNKDTGEEVAWKEEKLIFNNVPLSQIASELSNYFNTKIEITDNTLKQYKLTARFENKETLEEILTLLQTSGNFSWNRNFETIIINPKQ